MWDVNEIKTRFSNSSFSELISSITLKNSRIFITLEIEAPEQQTSITEAALNILHDFPKDSINFIFTNKNLKHPELKPKLLINNVKNVILVSSGKGGVGKSTMALALAEKYRNGGHKVGLVDADIYGPSIPRMLGVSIKPEIVEGKFIPLDVRNIKVMSMGFLVDENASIAWRGPMVSKILYQMLSSTSWGELDYIIIDTPPGTGDIHLSILENYKINGAWIITTPQKISQDDVSRTIELYLKFSVPILGLIENMSDIFYGTAGQELAKKYGIGKLIQVPYIKEIAKNADLGNEYDSLIEFIP